MVLECSSKLWFSYYFLLSSIYWTFCITACHFSSYGYKSLCLVVLCKVPSWVQLLLRPNRKKSLFQLTSLKILWAVGRFFSRYFICINKSDIHINDLKEIASAEHLVVLEHGFRHCCHLLEIEGQTSTGCTRSSTYLETKTQFQIDTTTQACTWTTLRSYGTPFVTKFLFLKSWILRLKFWIITIQNFKVKILDYNNPV